MDTINIACSFNNAYSYQAAGLLASIVRHASAQWHYVIYIVHDDINEYNQYQLNKLYSRNNVELKYLNFDFKTTKVDQLYVKNGITKHNHARLFLHRMLPELSRILYLDCDIIVTTDLVDLYNSDLEGRAVGVCPDINALDETNLDKIVLVEDFKFYGTRRNYFKQYLFFSDLEMKQYFNAGMMLIDLKKAGKYLDQAPELIASHKYLSPNQDPLNILFKQDKKLLHCKFDFPAPLLSQYISSHASLPDVIHYIRLKPGQFPKNYDNDIGCAEYFELLKGTGYYYMALDWMMQAKFQRQFLPKIKNMEQMNSFYRLVVHQLPFTLPVPRFDEENYTFFQLPLSADSKIHYEIIFNRRGFIRGVKLAVHFEGPWTQYSNSLTGLVQQVKDLKLETNLAKGELCCFIANIDDIYLVADTFCLLITQSLPYLKQEICKIIPDQYFNKYYLPKT